MMWTSNRLSLLLSVTVSLACAAQIPFLGESIAEVSSATYDASSQTISTLSHPKFPAHTLRFVQPPGDICESHGTRSWSGYLDVDLDALWKQNNESASFLEEQKDSNNSGVIEHFYFWAFESRNNPKEDPTVMWLNGGPGCSSGCGMLMELGPCNARNYNSSKGPHTVWNPHSWSNNASLLFLDQPVGTGFSYASWADSEKKGEAPYRIYGGVEAGRDASAFLQLWGLHAERLFGQSVSSFHIAGESYSGRWIPLIADQLVKDNKLAVSHPERGLKPLPLDSVMIGNGITSPKHQFQAYVDYACANTTGYGVFLPKEKCDTMYSQIPACMALVEKCNTPTEGELYDALACKSALSFCEAALQDPWSKTGMSAYDYLHFGDYKEDDWFATFLNDNKTKEALGIDFSGAGDRHDGTFLSCSDNVYKNFAKTGDGAKSSMYAVKDLLENDVRVLLYAGERDFICNYLGIDAWTRDLEWSGAQDFRKAELVAWHKPQEDVEAGLHRTFGNMTFLTVHHSGHFVPYDQPEASLKMFNSWVHDKAPPS
ncbi:hypothetical protein CBS101457_002280 [Exobasidium rhododendri]|nr:hypothetical protein CBS101457_002280 [Exobasidium rhododendri]